jgi:hypothetical protein
LVNGAPFENVLWFNEKILSSAEQDDDDDDDEEEEDDRLQIET